MAKRAVMIDISADSKKFVSASKQAEQAAKGLQTKIEDVGKSLALAYTAKKVVDFGVSAVKAAVDDAAAQEVLRKAVEGATGARNVDMKSIESWIGTTQNATGVLDDELRPALATLVGATKDVGKAQELMGTALDVARAKGVPLETVATALAKAYAGNSTALNKLVPGLKSAGESTLKFADAKDRLNQMFGGTAAAWAETDAGKMARLNAQWSDMQETLGAALIPALSKVAGIVSDVFGWFNSLDEGSKNLIVTIGLVGAGLYVAVAGFTALRAAVIALGVSTGAVNPILAGIGVAVAGAVAIMSLFRDEESAATKLAKDLNDTLHAGASAFDVNKVAALSAADAVREYGGAATADMDAKLQKTYLESENLRKGLLGLGLTIKDVTGLAHGEADAQAVVIAARRKAVADGKIQVKTFGGIQLAQDDVTAALDRWILTGERARVVGNAFNVVWSDSESQIFAVTSEMTKQNQAWAENIDLAKEQALLGDKQAAAWLKASGNLSRLTVVEQANVNALLDGSSAVAGAWEKVAGWGHRAASAAGAAADSTSRMGEAARNGNRPIETFAGLLETISGRFATAKTRADGFRQAIEALSGGKLDLQASTDALIAGQQKLDGVIGAATDKTNKMTDAERAAALSLDANTETGRANREMFRSRVGDIDANVAAMLAAGASTEDAATAMEFQRAVLVNQAQAFGLTRDQAETYVNQLGLTPDAISTAVKLLGTTDAEAKLAALARTRTVLFNVRTVDSGIRVGGVTYRAAGGPVQAGRPYIVGEHRPELFIPKVDGRIIPRVPPSTASASSSGGWSDSVVVNVNAPVYGVRDLRRAIVDAIRDARATPRFA